MNIVFAYHTDKDHQNLQELPELVGKTVKSFNAALDLLSEGDSAILGDPRKGFKTVEVRDGKRYIQRNYVPEW